jgi:hypothetical protein
VKLHSKEKILLPNILIAQLQFFSRISLVFSALSSNLWGECLLLDGLGMCEFGT